MENHLNTNKIPTAEEFINENGGFLKYSSAQEFVECQSLMIEFAKLHVEAALKEAKWRCDDVTNSEGLGLYVENSYPLENIK